jgi:hypothetical protein
MIKYKQFMIFSFTEFYPSGGLSDVMESFDDFADAIAYIKGYSSEYLYIFDRINGEIVYDKK